MDTKTLTQTELKTLLDYNKNTGDFTWKIYRGGIVKVGGIAGKVELNGYHRIKVNGKLYQAHRLAWFYVYNEWPSKDLDHINRVRSDNRIANLRLATRSENAQNTKIRINNSSSIIGVSWNKRKNKWRAYITKDYKQIHLGFFDTKEDASLARQKAVERIFSNEFYNKAT